MARFVVELSGWHWSLEGRRLVKESRWKMYQVYHCRLGISKQAG
jgi:hypothetical protein